MPNKKELKEFIQLLKQKIISYPSLDNSNDFDKDRYFSLKVDVLKVPEGEHIINFFKSEYKNLLSKEDLLDIEVISQLADKKDFGDEWMMREQNVNLYTDLKKSRKQTLKRFFDYFDDKLSSEEKESSLYKKIMDAITSMQ